MRVDAQFQTLMESVAEREERIKRLEESRANREAQGSIWPTPDDAGLGGIPIELGPGRGDLNYGLSGQYPPIPTALALVGNRAVSFARIFMSQPWVAASVNRLLTYAVRVPLVCYRRVGDDYNERQIVKPDEHPVAAVIEKPWLGGCQADLVQHMLCPVLVHGNAVIQALSGRSGTVSLDPKDWRFTIPVMPFRDTIDAWVFNSDSPEYRQRVSADEVLHCHWWSPTGPIGVSPLQQLGVTIQIEDAIQRFQKGMFANGARPPSAITASDQFLGLQRAERQAIMAQLRRDIIDIYSGPDNAGRPALLPPGLDWKAVGQTAVEAALLEQRQVTKDEIHGVYLLPPPTEKANVAQLQVLREVTYTDTLGPYLILLEQQFNAQIVRDLLQDDEIFVEFDFTAVLRGDPLTHINALRSGIGSGMITPNEARNKLGLPRAKEEGMDSFYLPTNNLTELGTDKAGSPTPPPPPNPPFPPNPDNQQQPPGQPPNQQPSQPPPTTGRKTLHVTTRDYDFEVNR